MSKKARYQYYIVIKDRFITLEREELEQEIGSKLLCDMEWEAKTLPEHKSRITHLISNEDHTKWQDVIRYQVDWIKEEYLMNHKGECPLDCPSCLLTYKLNIFEMLKSLCSCSIEALTTYSFIDLVYGYQIHFVSFLELKQVKEKKEWKKGN